MGIANSIIRVITKCGLIIFAVGISKKMYYLADFLVFFCLFGSGYFFGYYCKFAYIYDNLWIHWYAVVGGIATLSLAAILTLRKYKQRQYQFDHFYMIFYGLICSVISCCFMLTDNLDICFYFGFIGLGTTLIPSYSYISLRSSSRGWRPARIALGNAIYFAGLTSGFSVFNEFEPKYCGWIYLGIVIALLLGLAANEFLQHLGVQNYKQSCDLAFNLLNEEKLIFLPNKSVYALFVGRDDFILTRNRQWLVVGIATVVVLERVFLYSASYFQLIWSSAFAYLSKQYLYMPFLLYTLGCASGAALLLRYKAKLVYLMFALIKITVTAAILGVYTDETTENCFLFLCFYYICMGVYASVALQLILECTPFLFTELALAVAFTWQLCVLEALKYETRADDAWHQLLGMGIFTMLLTASCIVLVQVFLPTESRGLVDMRNELLGIRRNVSQVPQTKLWQANFFVQHDLQPHEVKCVRVAGNRVFQQYPRESATKLQESVSGKRDADLQSEFSDSKGSFF